MRLISTNLVPLLVTWCAKSSYNFHSYGHDLIGKISLSHLFGFGIEAICAQHEVCLQKSLVEVWF
uniref:Uncharacterized protein n=1 Tax=Tetraselmis sp. GSL018 TaxID=582737 RepID=A0A061R0V0_9CHLO